METEIELAQKIYSTVQENWQPLTSLQLQVPTHMGNANWLSLAQAVQQVWVSSSARPEQLASSNADESVAMGGSL